tara:strand:- start:329 stop:616 length:288 start_codon:yes stop_codon:yes gene_type:complete
VAKPGTSLEQRRLAERLKRLRSMRGWNQLVAAQHCGMKGASYSDIEACNKRVDLDKLVTLARVFKVTVGFLIEGTLEGVPLESREQMEKSIEWLK